MNREILDLHIQVDKIYAMAEQIFDVVKSKHSEEKIDIAGYLKEGTIEEMIKTFFLSTVNYVKYKVIYRMGIKSQYLWISAF